MYSYLSQSLSQKLSHFNQRKLNKPELVLFAKAIADSLPLAPVETDNVSLFTLNHRSFVDECCYVMSAYSFIDRDEVKLVYSLIDQFTLWRMSLAYKPPRVVFKAKTDTVIDDITTIERFVDAACLCSLGDIATNANWYMGMFYDLVGEISVLRKNTNQV